MNYRHLTRLIGSALLLLLLGCSGANLNFDTRRNRNVPPRITNLTATPDTAGLVPGKVVTLAVTVDDPDNPQSPGTGSPTLIYNWTCTGDTTCGPCQDFFLGGGAEVKFLPPCDGVFTIGVKVEDGHGIQVGPASIVLHIGEGQSGPQIKGKGVTVVPQVGRKTTLWVVAIGSDGSTTNLRYFWTVPNGELGEDPSNPQVDWTPASTDMRGQNVMIEVVDASGLSSGKKPYDEITQILPASTASPVIVSTSYDVTPTVSHTTQLTVEATDPDGTQSNLRYDWSVPNGTITPHSGSPKVADWVPSAAGSVTSGTLQVTVTDPDRNTTATAGFAIFEVQALPNAAPQVTISLPQTPPTAEAATRLTALASDDEGLSGLHYYWTVPNGTIAEVTGHPEQSDWTPADAGTGEIITVRVVDAGGLEGTDSLTVDVAPAPNAAPEVTILSPQTPPTATKPTRLTALATDDKPLSELHYYWTVPNGTLAEVSSHPEQIDWTPADPGTGEIVSVRVVDAEGLEGTASLAVDVGPPP